MTMSLHTANAQLSLTQLLFDLSTAWRWKTSHCTSCVSNEDGNQINNWFTSNGKLCHLIEFVTLLLICHFHHSFSIPFTLHCTLDNNEVKYGEILRDKCRYCTGNCLHHINYQKSFCKANLHVLQSPSANCCPANHNPSEGVTTFYM